MHLTLPVCLEKRSTSLIHNAPPLMCSFLMGLLIAEGWSNIDGKVPLHIASMVESMLYPYSLHPLPRLCQLR